MESRLRIEGIFKALYLRRYKRFFVDVQLESGEILTVHCPNTGSMLSILENAKYAWCTLSNNPKRKLKATLEILELEDGTRILVNTQRPNQIVAFFLQKGMLNEWFSYQSFKSEQKYGEGSRIDFLLDLDDNLKHFVEVKNVTLRLEDGCISFPDAVTSRGAKHLQELANCVEQGHLATNLFLVSRTDATQFRIAKEIDTNYGLEAERAQKKGVRFLALKIKMDILLDVQCVEISLDQSLPLLRENL